MTSKASRTADLVFYAPSTMGGLYEHTKYQAESLARSGFAVEVMTCGDPTKVNQVTQYKIVEILQSPPQHKNRSLRRVARLWSIRNNIKIAVDHCRRTKAPIFFLESFFEYGAPLWSGMLMKLAKSGVCIGANLHDPVRDFQIGPKWWHDFSVANAWKPISFALAHQSIPKESKIPTDKDVSIVPVGVYQPSSPSIDKSEALLALKIPDDQPLFLFFGFIRDNKNLDLAIKALSKLPRGRIIVAGNSQSSKDKSVEFYKALARDVGVSDRVRFDTEFIEESKIGLYFSACDTVLLTYSSEFRSQSGVLNIAANYRKPVIASSGDSPLVDCVSKYSLGTVIEPDNENKLAQAMRNGIQRLPDWDGYAKYATWETNVEPLATKIRELTRVS